MPDPADRVTRSLAQEASAVIADAMAHLEHIRQELETRLEWRDLGPSEDEEPEEEEDTEGLIEAAWRRETGSNDPQGPPAGWRPRWRPEP